MLICGLLLILAGVLSLINQIFGFSNLIIGIFSWVVLIAAGFALIIDSQRLGRVERHSTSYYTKFEDKPDYVDKTKEEKKNDVNVAETSAATKDTLKKDDEVIIIEAFYLPDIQQRVFKDDHAIVLEVSEKEAKLKVLREYSPFFCSVPFSKIQKIVSK